MTTRVANYFGAVDGLTHYRTGTDIVTMHIAHNTIIGENTAIAGMSGTAGSVRIGKNCQIAGQVGIIGHIEIADNVTVMAKTLVTKSLKEAGVYSGVMPIQKHKDSLKFIAKIKNDGQ